MGARRDDRSGRNDHSPGDGEFAVGLCQYEFGASTSSLDDLLGRTEKLFERAGEADLYVLPELFVTDCLDAADEEVATLDEDDRETFHDFLVDAADRRDAVVVGGSYNVTGDGETYNRCPVAVPETGVKIYDKSNPTPEERESGKCEGTSRPPVVEHRGVGIGVAVCYDVEFPELVRDLADRGAEVIAVPSWTASEAGYQRVSRCAAGRAVENQCFVAQVSAVGARADESDAAGEPGGASATGRSAVYAPCDDVVGPHGTRLSVPRDEHAAATCSVSVADLRKSREDASVRPYADAKRSNERKGKSSGRDGKTGERRGETGGRRGTRTED
jgi:predicted amidohydrolase